MLFPNERDICLPTLKPRATPKLRVEAMIAMDIAPRDGLIVIPTVVIGLWLVAVASTKNNSRNNDDAFFVSEGRRKERKNREAANARGSRGPCVGYPEVVIGRREEMMSIIIWIW